MFRALASIPDSLRGSTWLTISELALVAQVPENPLDSMLTPLRSKHWNLQKLRIEKASERRDRKGSKTYHYYRPYTGMTVHVGHCMSSREGRAVNEASKSTELRAALAREPSQAVQITMPTLAESDHAASNDHCTRQKWGAKRLKRSADDERPLVLGRSESSKPAKVAASKGPTRPHFPHSAIGYLSQSTKDGGRVYFIFSEDHLALEQSVVFAPPRPVGNGGTAQKWEVYYKVSIRGTLVHQNRIRAVNSSSLQSQIHSMLESVGSVP
jgi:hypothetical protein